MGIALMCGITSWILGVLVQTYAQVAKAKVAFGWILIILGGAVAVFAGVWLGWAHVLAGAG